MPIKKPGKNIVGNISGFNSEAGKKERPARKADRIDYVCYASFKYDSVRRVKYYILRIETIALFSSFAYGISLSVSRNKKIIDLQLKGLFARSNSVPLAAPASAEVQLEDLLGEYTINIIKSDGSVNSAVIDFNIIKKEIVLKRKFLPENSDSRWFCDFLIDVNNFSFSEK